MDNNKIGQNYQEVRDAIQSLAAINLNTVLEAAQKTMPWLINQARVDVEDVGDYLDSMEQTNDLITSGIKAIPEAIKSLQGALDKLLLSVKEEVKK